MLQPRSSPPRVSVVVPARDEAATVAGVVRGCLSVTGVGEVVVVDDGSRDATASVAADAGARVVDARTVLAREAPGPGKGQAMWKGVSCARGDVIVFCDADLRDFDPHYVTALVEALEQAPGAAMVKARYHRHGTGGRVNELVARPLIELVHPALARLSQPLGGEYAAHRAVLERVPFVHGYGVDLGLVLDIARAFGPASVIEADLGSRTHRNRPLDELRPQARAVLEVALHRAGLLAAEPPACPPLCELEAYVRPAV